MKSLISTVLLSLLSLNALAGNAVPPDSFAAVPEPDALALFAIGAVGGIAIWLRNRGRK